MRKRLLYLSVAVIAVVVFAFAGCKMFGNDYNEQTEEDVLKEGYGKIEIQLPENTSSKTWDNTVAQSEASVFEVLVYNDTNQYTSGLLTTSGVHYITVYGDTYNILVLAGNYDSASGTCFIGADHITKVDVPKDGTVSQSVTLNTLPSFNVTVTNEILVNTDFDVSVSFESPETVIYPNWFPNDNNQIAYAKIYLNDNIESTGTINLSESNGVWSGSTTLTSPSTTGTGQVKFLGPELGLNDPDYPSLYTDLNNYYSETVWYFPNHNYIYDSSSTIFKEVVKDISIIGTTDGTISMDIGWGSS